MRKGLELSLVAFMVIYVIYRVFVTFLILPLAGTLWSLSGIYFVVLVLMASASIVLSFKGRQALSVSLAVLVGLAGLSFWWFVICRSNHPIWSDFGWFVVPEVGFSLASLFNAYSRRSDVP
jgi:hypothetical protein